MLLVTAIAAAISGWMITRRDFGKRPPNRDDTVFIHSRFVLTKELVCGGMFTFADQNKIFKRIFELLVHTSRSESDIERYVGNSLFCELATRKLLEHFAIRSFDEFVEASDRSFPGEGDISDYIYSARPEDFLDFIKRSLQDSAR